MSDPPATDTDPFAGFQATLDRIGKRLDAVDRMEQRLTEICSDMDELKRGYIARNQAAQLPVAPGTGVVQTPSRQLMLTTPMRTASSPDSPGVNAWSWKTRTRTATAPWTVLEATKFA